MKQRLFGKVKVNVSGLATLRHAIICVESVVQV